MSPLRVREPFLQDMRFVRLHCSRCDAAVSGVVPLATIVSAFILCYRCQQDAKVSQALRRLMLACKT